jgi:hypothetical protein
MEHLGIRLKAIMRHCQAHHIANRFNLESDPRMLLLTRLIVRVRPRLSKYLHVKSGNHTKRAIDSFSPPAYTEPNPRMFKRYLARLPLTDRITFYFDFWGGLCYGAFNGLAIPLIPIVARRIGMSPAGIAAMLTMQFVGALSGMFLGLLADRRKKMPFVVWPGIAARTLLSFLAFTRGPTGFFIISSVFYLLSNVGGPAYASIMRSNYSDENRGRLMGDIRVSLMLVSAVCSTLAALLLGSHSEMLKWLFPAASFFGVLSSLIFSRIKVKRVPVVSAGAGRPSRADSLRAALSNAPFLLFMGIFFLSTAPDKFAIPLEPLRLVDELHLDYRDASAVLGTVVSLSGIIGYVFWGRAMKKANSYHMLAIVVFLTAGRYVVLALAQDVFQLVPMGIMGGLAYAGWDLVPLFCIIPLTDPANFSFYFGLHTTLLGVRGVAGPLIGALVYNTGAFSLSVLFLLIAGLTVIGGLLLFPFARRRGPTVSPGAERGARPE